MRRGVLALAAAVLASSARRRRRSAAGRGARLRRSRRPRRRRAGGAGAGRAACAGQHHQADDGARRARARASTTWSRSRRRPPASASRRSNLRPGERITVRDLAIAALVPSANDAATALAVHVGHGSVATLRRADEREGASARPRSTHFENPHGLDQPGHVSSARDVTTMLAAALAQPVHPDVVDDGRRRRSPAAGRSTSTDDLLGELPLVGAKTGHTNAAGWSQVAAVRAGRRADHRVRARGAERGAAEQRPRGAARVGARAVPARSRRSTGAASTGSPRPGTAGRRFSSSRARGRPHGAGRHAARRARRGEHCAARCPLPAASASARCGSSRAVG